MSEPLCDPKSLVNIISSLSGSISFVIWLVAQLPQLIETYQNKTVDGISPYFFLIWLIGDITSFIGCVLTKQMYFQYVIAVYFLLNDVILCGQYYYYRSIYKKKRRHSSIHHHHPNHHHTGYGSSIQNVAKAALPASIIASNIGSSEALSIFSPIELTNNKDLTTLINGETLGVWCSWIGAAFYVCARIPQLLKNYERKSTADLSPFLFICTLSGNLTYGLSIMFSCDFIYDDVHRWEFFWNELPFMIGSAGTIFFDILYFYQMYIYRDVKSEERERSLLLG